MADFYCGFCGWDQVEDPENDSLCECNCHITGVPVNSSFKAGVT